MLNTFAIINLSPLDGVWRVNQRSSLAWWMWEVIWPFCLLGARKLELFFAPWQQWEQCSFHIVGFRNKNKASKKRNSRQRQNQHCCVIQNQMTKRQTRNDAHYSRTDFGWNSRYKAPASSKQPERIRLEILSSHQGLTRASATKKNALWSRKFWEQHFFGSAGCIHIK